MNKKKLVALFVFAISIIGGAVYYIGTQVESYEEYVFKGWSEDARRNPFLAAEQFLKKRIDDVESSYDLSVLDSLGPNTTLIIKNANHVLNERRVETVLKWLEAGGHIIVQAQMLDDDETDVLLSRFEVTKYHVEETQTENFESFRDFSRQRRNNESTDPPADLGDSNAEEETEKKLSDRMRESFEAQEEFRRRQEIERAVLQNHREVDDILRALEGRLIDENSTRLRFRGDEYELRADFSGSGSLDHPFFYIDEEDEDDYEGYAPFYWAGNENTTGFLQFDVGEGMLSVMSDMNVWQSDQIGFYDHAYLLAVLTEESDRVVFLVGANVPNIIQLLWRNFTELCIALLFLFVFGVIYRMRRFGLAVSFDRSVRRSFKEHLDAMSHYYWRQGLAEKLVVGLRGDIVRILQRQYFVAFRENDAESKEKPSTSNSSLEIKMLNELQKKLIEAVGISNAEAAQALTEDVPQDEVKFYHLVRLLQKIRNHL